ncbi:sucrase ferredoxin [Deinococcus planocerae]|uniref:sucrase ferredoxin n=1 Tax=Deinococcus planocerae TaxID=1737569 RepID=UPI001FE88236|nr:sucrase ferredoxin [Deinococcus planocerae]
MSELKTPPARLPLCADASRAAGEDPIGTAPHWQEVTVLELGVPVWASLRNAEAWTSEQRGVFEALRGKVEASGAGFGLLMAAPERSGGPLRVRHHVRGAGGFTRRDYESDLPQTEWARGLTATLLHPEGLVGGEWAEVPAPSGSDHHVCTHGTVDAACGKYGMPVYHGLRREGHRVWRTGHFGGHRFAATAVELPSGLLWAHLTPELAGRIARREVHPAEVGKHLRGFAGLPAPAQVLDRELLARHGWDWLNAERTARVQTEEEGIRVTLSYTWNGERGHASALVREAEPLHLPGSSHRADLGPVRQYAAPDVQIAYGEPSPA